jgi:hypothetical protein
VPLTPAGQVAAPRLHGAARVEDAVHQFVERRLRRGGWQVTIVAYPGYGAPGWIRVMGRVLLGRLASRPPRRPESVRGRRSLTMLPPKGVPVVIEAGDTRYDTTADATGLSTPASTGPPAGPVGCPRACPSRSASSRTLLGDANWWAPRFLRRSAEA